jgi:hypothetical protein
MSARIPFTPVTPEALARLEPAERQAFRAAAVCVAGDQKPPLGVIADLVLTIQRLVAEPAQDVEAAVAAERDRIRDLADRTKAVCTDSDEGTRCWFADLIAEEVSRG